jgi:hypothetical protein
MIAPVLMARRGNQVRAALFWDSTTTGLNAELLPTVCTVFECVTTHNLASQCATGMFESHGESVTRSGELRSHCALSHLAELAPHPVRVEIHVV